jgi:hypothetical protein
VEEEETKMAHAAKRDAAVKEATIAAAAVVTETEEENKRAPTTDADKTDYIDLTKKMMASLRPSILMSKPPSPQTKTFTAGHAVSAQHYCRLHAFTKAPHWLWYHLSL